MVGLVGFVKSFVQRVPGAVIALFLVPVKTVLVVIQRMASAAACLPLDANAPLAGPVPTAVFPVMTLSGDLTVVMPVCAALAKAFAIRPPVSASVWMAIMAPTVTNHVRKIAMDRTVATCAAVTLLHLLAVTL